MPIYRPSWPSPFRPEMSSANPPYQRRSSLSLPVNFADAQHGVSKTRFWRLRPVCIAQLLYAAGLYTQYIPTP